MEPCKVKYTSYYRLYLMKHIPKNRFTQEWADSPRRVHRHESLPGSNSSGCHMLMFFVEEIFCKFSTTEPNLVSETSILI